MANLENLGRRLSKLEERNARRQYTWKLQDGRKVTYDSIALYGAYMQLCEAIWEAWEHPDSEPAPFSGVLAALADAREGERERLAEHVAWLRLWDHEMQRLYTLPPEALEEV